MAQTIVNSEVARDSSQIPNPFLYIQVVPTNINYNPGSISITKLQLYLAKISHLEWTDT